MRFYLQTRKIIYFFFINCACFYVLKIKAPAYKVRNYPKRIEIKQRGYGYYVAGVDIERHSANETVLNVDVYNNKLILLMVMDLWNGVARLLNTDVL
jgi:hypothetical protein